MISLLALLAGFLLDLLIGDPHFLYHPVRLVGALISFLEKVIRKARISGLSEEEIRELFELIMEE